MNSGRMCVCSFLVLVKAVERSKNYLFLLAMPCWVPVRVRLGFGACWFPYPEISKALGGTRVFAQLWGPKLHHCEEDVLKVTEATCIVDEFIKDGVVYTDSSCILLFIYHVHYREKMTQEIQTFKLFLSWKWIGMRENMVWSGIQQYPWKRRKYCTG